jgi:hypothetical protein
VLRGRWPEERTRASGQRHQPVSTALDLRPHRRPGRGARG